MGIFVSFYSADVPYHFILFVIDLDSSALTVPPGLVFAMYT
jgi:hypothetical protein